MCELRERVWGIMYKGTYDVYIVRTENVNSSVSEPLLPSVKRGKVWLYLFGPPFGKLILSWAIDKTPATPLSFACPERP